MNGVLIVDKPSGMTSHDVVYRVRRLSGQKRVGHAGTLDPDATGVLLVCLGHATRLSDLLAAQGKEYDAVLRLGKTTTTEDGSGTVLTEVDPSRITENSLHAALPGFMGTIDQIPPMVSALHHNGQRLYDLARKGITVDRVARKVEIESIELVSFISGPDCCATLRVRCGKGTYIRTLCADLGASLGVGGYMDTLRRTRVGTFYLAQSTRLADLTPDNLPVALISSSNAVSFLPVEDLEKEAAADVLNGKRIQARGSYAKNELVRLRVGMELLALARFDVDGHLVPEKVFPPITDGG